ncbi:hypothetical protein CCR75_002460 [Bremia lactucae]|uniref:Heme haloperoxidase family profile domain-containing protein n=1 Tax=Bremia lactucae TaxID=4779 RepID=A0A976I9V4_BRELC|nr:hypothetical protein CCR75_002460 [Bremia lactucae]
MPYRRSPCPAINTLANHDYIPRNGQDINEYALGYALITVFNLGQEAAVNFLTFVPDVFSLDYFSTHNALSTMRR